MNEFFQKCCLFRNFFSKSKKRNWWSENNTIWLFCTVVILMQIWLLEKGSMINESGDAADIWKTITTYYTVDRYPSYVLYKGFAAIYPYVWLYHLALRFHLNDFFFIMCYHAVLFGYIICWGVPSLVEALTEYKTRFWQKLVLMVTLFWFWERYRVFNQLMVDLPSCAFFLMSIQCAAIIEQYVGWKRYLIIICTGLLCGLCANISGQYSISALCIMVFSASKVWKSALQTNIFKRIRSILPDMMLLVIAMFAVKEGKIVFNIMVVEPLASNGASIPSGEAWMRRALFYMLNIGRQLYGYTLKDLRGDALVTSLYGVENGAQLMEIASYGGYGWSIGDYFQAFFKHPVDFLILCLNRLVITMSDDCGNCSLRSLIPSYTMIYLAILSAIKNVAKIRDFFSAKLWLVLGALASIIPTMVMTVEIRVTLSFQALCFGMALAGPILPQLWTTILMGIRQCWSGKSLRTLREKRFPWEIIGWGAFCFICLGYFGAICAGSDLGVDMLYHW